MNISNTVRTLAVAALLAVTVVSVSAQQADARPIGPKQTDGPVVIDPIGTQKTPCAIQGYAIGSSNDWDFFAQGESITVNGQTYYCGWYGQWLKV